MSNPSTFTPVYQSGSGIGGFNLLSPADISFAFDYDHSGRLDHIVLYQPGAGTIWILKRDGAIFSAVYAQGAPGNGIGGYDLASTADRVFAFDYDHSGKLDHLVLYRPSTGIVWILKNDKGVFSPVFQSNTGIGGFNLLSPDDRALAFDYDHSGKLDHLLFYQPGAGTAWILKNVKGVFSAVYAQGAPGNGIGGYDLGSTADRIIAFDYEHCEKLDHLVLYRPNTGIVWILKNDKGTFSPVYSSNSGIGGFNLLSPNDHAFAFDYNKDHKLDHLTFYQPGAGTIWILKNDKGVFSPVYAQGAPGVGIGGYDLASTADRVYAYDYGDAEPGSKSGKDDGKKHHGGNDHLVLYRPNTGIIWILKNDNPRDNRK
ncbi:hypothetical protein SERLA73DRAFT_178372 [Serpula lacrymans var. lacrymans S7.3]|uniref:Uncharacterized protein n=2 Tax=Serpula lacrymans var. lacrymans TaxID=341189 RepID=F8PTK7_SERL3|nr:uncharacterized protein SERLADRAFT_462778 [Serpula lacrymans var. lacrymans S7.9]EGO00535.1 hypothetical protein SERLA73DRAFT_178372 [Serpula lacrymans var. lacrymans S7.3]EGO26094.1 hypothetical protein SERLADRAFT_462778 [Serpula lacrymans var. lacrymans S7.9]